MVAETISVNVQRTGMPVYGFQLSAVSDSNSAQAGTLSVPTADRRESGAIAPHGAGICEGIVTLSYRQWNPASYSFRRASGVFDQAADK